MIRKDILTTALAMLPVASDDATRYSINGVRLLSEESGVTLVACNGHMMIEKHLAPVDGVSMPLGCFKLHDDAAKHLKNILKSCKYTETLEADISSTGDLLVGFSGAKVSLEKESPDTYPPYKTFIPRADREEIGVFINAEYLLTLAKAIKGESKLGAPNICIRFNPFNPLEAVRVSVPGNDATAVVMPCRDDYMKELSGNFSKRLNGIKEESCSD